jgi:hypothetical protein
MKTTVSFLYAREIIQTYRSHGIDLQQAAQKVFGDLGVPAHVKDVSAEINRRLNPSSPLQVRRMVEKAAESPWPESVNLA